MTIDITKCVKVNIIDTCSIWNLLSSSILYSTLTSENFIFSITKFVEYESEVKARLNPSNREMELQHKFKKEKISGKFLCHSLSIEDLQDQDLLNATGQLGIGELSTIAFCKKTNQVFLTDDRKARKIGRQILGSEKVQTVPHILGWLFYQNTLSDNDLQLIVDEHNFFGRPLEKYFREVHLEALRIKCILK